MYKQGHTGGIRRYLRAQFEAEADAIIKIVMLKIKGGVIIIMCYSHKNAICTNWVIQVAYANI